MGEVRYLIPSSVARPRTGPEKRTALRFDAKGRLAGHLIGSNLPIFIQNLSLGGFAGEVSEPLPDSSHIVRLTTPDLLSTLLEARHIYCRPTRGADGTRRFWAGFEFVRPPQDVDRTIRSLLQSVTDLQMGS
jgi:hypothetical protein